MDLDLTGSLSKVYKGISNHTIFKDCSVPFEDRLAGLPGKATHFFGFESPLGREARKPDIAMCFSEESFNDLAQWCDTLSPERNSESYWLRIRDMAGGKGNSLREHLKSIWVEMDWSKGNARGLQEPGLFLELQHEKVDPGFARRDVIPLLTGNNHHPSCAMVEYCLSLLPNTGRLAHFGYFPTRSQEKLRMTISFDHYGDIAPYCGRIFGKGLNREIQSRIEVLSGLSDFGVLHLDIGTEIGPRLGIEMRFRENELNPEFQWRWGDVFSMLISQGLCSSEEAESILGFSGITRFIDDSTMSPSWYKYFLYYIKGVFDFSGKEHYKAYCAFQRLSPN